MLWIILAGGVAALLARFFSPEPEPIFGKYRQPGRWFWLKYIAMRLLLWIRNKKHINVDVDGQAVHPLVHKERMQTLGEHPLAFDAIFFMACSMDGTSLIVGSERRHHNVINSPIYVLIPGLGLLKHKKLPDTCLFGATNDAYGAEGIRIQPIEPLKTWKVEFDGFMNLKEDPSREFRVKLRCVYTGQWPAFNYDTDLHPHSMAKIIAAESWSRDYFKRLQSAHQSHYEQMGHINGTVQVDDNTYSLNLMSIRDHSTGPVRDMDLLYRYAFYMMFLEDGTMASVIVVNQPCSVSMMESGYVCLPGGAVHNMEWCDFQLYQHGEDGEPPTDHAFSFKAGGTIYRVKVKGEEVAFHFVGWQWEAKIIEMFSTFEINGVKGRGLSEFHYHNSSGRPSNVAATDPEWFADVVKKTYSTPSPYSLRDATKRPYYAK